MSEAEWVPTVDVPGLVDKMVPLCREAFSDLGPVSRGKFLRLKWYPPAVAELRKTFAIVLANNPGATFDEVAGVILEDRIAYYQAVADGAGLDPLGRASLLAAVRKGFDLATRDGHGHGHSTKGGE